MEHRRGHAGAPASEERRASRVEAARRLPCGTRSVPPGPRRGRTCHGGWCGVESPLRARAGVPEGPRRGTARNDEGHPKTGKRTPVARAARSSVAGMGRVSRDLGRDIRSMDRLQDRGEHRTARRTLSRDAGRRTRLPIPSRSRLARGVTVAQVVLVHFVLVRIQAGQFRSRGSDAGVPSEARVRR